MGLVIFGDTPKEPTYIAPADPGVIDIGPASRGLLDLDFSITAQASMKVINHVIRGLHQKWSNDAPWGEIMLHSPVPVRRY